MQIIIDQKPRKAILAKKILHWIVCTRQPLSLPELQHALAVGAGDTTGDPDELMDEADIIPFTAGLVTVDFEKSVRIHITLHDYLFDHLEELFPGAELQISQTLLTYLNFQEFGDPCENNSEDLIKARLKTRPLLSYASQYWSDHVPGVCHESDIRSVLLEFLGNAGKVASCIQTAYYLDSKICTKIDVRKGINGLHLFAIHGLDPVIPDLILKCGISNDSTDPLYDQTPLIYACRHGHISIVTKLLDLGASINHCSARESRPFREAYLGPHLEVIRLLLQKQELDVNAIYLENSNRTVLMMAACSKGTEEIVRLLLQRPDIDVNVQDQEGNTALSLASLSNNTAVVELLLDQPNIMINLGNQTGCTPLIIAAWYGRTAVVKQLLNKGADISIQDKEGGGTALQRAVDQGRIALIKIFIDHKVDLHTTDKFGSTLVHSASINEHEEVVRLLSKNGLSMNTQGNRGEAPLHDASRTGNYAVSKLLLDLDADRTVKDKSGRTPATFAWHHGHARVLQLLEETTGDPGRDPASTISIPRPENLPTWSLVKLGLADLIRQRISHILLNLSDDDPHSLTTKDPDSGDTPLHYAVQYKRYEILELLLQARVPPDPQNHVKRTPLWLAVSSRNSKTANIILRYKPALNIPDTWGTTPLLAALLVAQKSHNYDLAVTLLDAGAPFHEAYRPYIQPTFFAAVRLRSIKMVTYLITRGADQMWPDLETGMTAKQMGRANDDVEMLRTLDQHKSEFFAPRSLAQQEEDYARALIYQEGTKGPSEFSCYPSAIATPRYNSETVISSQPPPPPVSEPAVEPQLPYIFIKIPS